VPDIVESTILHGRLGPNPLRRTPALPGKSPRLPHAPLRIDTHRVVWLMASLVLNDRLFQCAEDNAFDLIRAGKSLF
jgi:hypothetical protein